MVAIIQSNAYGCNYCEEFVGLIFVYQVVLVSLHEPDKLCRQRLCWVGAGKKSRVMHLDQPTTVRYNTPTMGQVFSIVN